MLYSFTGVMNDTQKPDRVITNSPPSPGAHNNSTPKNRRKRAAVESFENIAEQLESVVILTNALILTEAVRTKNTSVGKIVIDSLMISQMPKDIDWIEKIGLAKLNSSKISEFEKLIARMEPLKEIFEKGEKFDVPVDLIDKLNYGELSSFSKKAALLLDLTKIDETIWDFVRANPVFLKQFILLPYTTEVVASLEDFSALDDLVDAINFVKETERISAHELLQKSETECKNYEIGRNGYKNEGYLRRCLMNLQSVAKTLTKPLLRFEEATMIFNFYSAANIITYGPSSYESKIVDSIKKLETVVPLFEEIKKLGNDEQQTKQFRRVINDLNSLKQSSSELEKLKKSLDLFVPLAQSVDEMIDLLNIGDVSASTSLNKIDFLNKFKSYKCLPNGAGSFMKLKDVLDVSKPLSLEYILSGILARLPVLKEYEAIYNPIIQHSAGLKAVEGLSEGISRLLGSSELSKTIINFKVVRERTEKISELSDVKKALELVATHCDALERHNNWKAELNEAEQTIRMSLGNSKRMTDLLLSFPDYFEFVSKLQKPSFLSSNFIAADYSVLESNFENMTDIIADLPIAIRKAENFFREVQINHENLKDGIEYVVKDLQNNFARVKTFDVLRFKPVNNANMKESVYMINNAKLSYYDLSSIQSKKKRNQRLCT